MSAVDIKEKEVVKEIPELKKKTIFYFFFKRFFDILLSSLAIIILSPIMLVIAIVIKCTSKGPIFYVSDRVGKDGKMFKMLKFRSMIINAEDMKKDLLDQNEVDGPVFKMEHDPRVTKFGAFLRKTSLDEIPQFFNVFIGNMSLVGPRPPIPSEVEQYNEYHKLRLTVKPGITCIWQCSGRCNVTFEEWIDMDVEYIQKRSLWFDFYLLIKTIPAVLSRKGAK